MQVKERMALIMRDVNIKGFPKVVLYTENQVEQSDQDLTPIFTCF